MVKPQVDMAIPSLFPIGTESGSLKQADVDKNLIE